MSYEMSPNERGRKYTSSEKKKSQVGHHPLNKVTPVVEKGLVPIYNMAAGWSSNYSLSYQVLHGSFINLSVLCTIAGLLWNQRLCLQLLKGTLSPGFCSFVVKTVIKLYLITNSFFMHKMLLSHQEEYIQ